MKITNIEQEENIWIVTKTPNTLQRIFGVKETKSRYKDTGSKYHYFPTVRVYLNQGGEILGGTHKITSVLENWRRKF